jgi:hypothetical protein
MSRREREQSRHRDRHGRTGEKKRGKIVQKKNLVH